MIRSFASRDTEQIFHREPSRRLPAEVQRAALRKLRIIHRAASLRDLAAVPGNRLEALRGDRMGYHSIRINRQWRICFRWSRGDAFDVEIIDYH